MDKPTMAICAAFILAVTFFAGMALQRYIVLDAMRSTVALYETLVQLQNRLTETMDEIDAYKRTSCGGYREAMTSNRIVRANDWLYHDSALADLAQHATAAALRAEHYNNCPSCTCRADWLKLADERLRK